MVCTAPTLQTISIMRLKCWVPFFGVLCNFVVLGGLGGYPLQQIFRWPSDIYRNWVGKKNGTKIVAFHAKMPWFVFVTWWNSCDRDKLNTASKFALVGAKMAAFISFHISFSTLFAQLSWLCVLFRFFLGHFQEMKTFKKLFKNQVDRQSSDRWEL